MAETVWDRKYPSERKFIAWNHCWPMARLSAESKRGRFTCYNTRLRFKESLKALIFWTHLCSVSSLVSVVNPSSPFSCNLLPAWRASPHWPAAGNPKLSTVTNTPTVIRNSPAAPTPLPSSYFLNLSESQPTKVSHIHYPTPLFRRKILHSFVLRREKKSGSARGTLVLPPSAAGHPSPTSLLPRSSFICFHIQLIEKTCFLVHNG